jgi:hypothetical protein
MEVNMSSEIIIAVILLGVGLALSLLWLKVDDYNVISRPHNNIGASTSPTASSDSTLGYSAGSVWLDTTGNKVWFCYSAAVGAATWKGAALT